MPDIEQLNRPDRSAHTSLFTPILVEVTRGTLVESVHRGFIAVVDLSGNVIASLGDSNTRTWFRSAAKPFQAIPLLTSGAASHYHLTTSELAVSLASHNGEAIHLTQVSSILNKIGLAESDLLCGAHLPFDPAAAKQLQEENRQPGALHNNCSGKHAGMLALAKYLHEPVADYINPSHAIQRQMLITLAMFADVPVDEIAIAVDGCSAPVFGLSLVAMARSYAQLVAAEKTEIPELFQHAARRVVSAMTEHPELIGGTSGRLDTDLMRVACGRIISKVGAEGVQLLGVLPCADYPDGLGIAIKIADGDTRRARDPVVIETLRQLGLLNATQLAELADYAQAIVRNHRQLAVGEVRARFRLK